MELTSQPSSGLQAWAWSLVRSRLLKQVFQANRAAIQDQYHFNVKLMPPQIKAIGNMYGRMCAREGAA
jgi:hypothetical protein